jgi:prevent-host-death family protein
VMVSISSAKSSLSRLVKAIEQGHECEIIITRNGRPVAKLVSAATASTGARIGIAEGKFEVPNNIDTTNDELARLFLGGANL